MKTLLINPPTGLYVREDRCQCAVGEFMVQITRPPQDLMLMASALEEIGVECKIRDYPIEEYMRHVHNPRAADHLGTFGSWGDCIYDIQDFRPDILVVSTTTPTFEQDMKVCAKAKEFLPDILTVAKGAHVSLFDWKALTKYSLDLVIRGESVFTLRDWIQSDNHNKVLGVSFNEDGTIIRTPNRSYLDPNDLPMPARHLIKNELYVRPDTGAPMAIIETSRGCPHDCIFCLTGQVFGKKIRYRQPDKVVDEIEECIDKFGIRNFHFKADTFTWSETWLIELCMQLLRRGITWPGHSKQYGISWICNSRVDTLDEKRILYMKKAGCIGIGLGVESGNQNILDSMKKGIILDQCREAVRLCKEHKIKSYMYFVLGMPWDTEKTIRDSIEFAKELDGDYAEFHIAYPFPGTEFYGIVKRENLLEEDSGKAYAEPVVSTYTLSASDLTNLRLQAMKEFYLRPKYIIRTLMQIRSWRELKYGIQAVRKLKRIAERCEKG